MAAPLPSARHDAALQVPTAYVRDIIASFARGTQGATVVPTAGSVTQDGRTTQRWSGSLTVGLDALQDPPTVPSDLLTPFGTTVDVEMGVILADGSSSRVAVGSFLLTGTRASLSTGARTVELNLGDLSTRIAEHRFERPFTVGAGADLADMVAQVAQDRDPTVDVGSLTPTGAVLGRRAVFGLDAQLDPWAELVSVVKHRGFRLYFDRFGAIVLDQPPATITNLRTVDVGEVGIDFSERPANVVVARGEPTDGTGPWYGLWEDDDPSSPTFVGGPYGRKTLFYASPLFTSDAEAQAAADSIGSAIQSAGAAWSVSRPYDPTWDPDDGIQITLPSGVTQRLVVDSVTYDIGGTTSMQVHTSIGGAA